MRIVIWGTGKIFEKYKEFFEFQNVVAIVDNDPKKQGTKYNNVNVISFEELKKVVFDRIYICSSIHGTLMYKQLTNLGIEKEKIFFYFDFERQDNSCQIYNDTNIEGNENNRVALLSHDFSNTGAPNCLLFVTEHLKKKGYLVKVGSPVDGDLREQFIQLGAVVYVDSRLKVGTLDGIEWIEDCGQVLVNTNQLYYLLRGQRKNVIWWLHEPIENYKNIIPSVFKGVLDNCINIYSVSKMADEGIKSISPNTKIRRMVYGIKDYHFSDIANLNNKLTFTIVGEISFEKGHDILCKALEQLIDEDRKKIRVICIGNDKTSYAEDFIESMDKLKVELEIKGFIHHDEVMRVIHNSDCLICASRMESMSMVVTEAFMLEVPVIVSSKAGITEFVLNKENAYIFNNENSADLASSIKEIIENRSEAITVGKRGREIYKKFFTIEKFEKSLDEIFINK